MILFSKCSLQIWMNQIVKKINELNPDIIFIGGDLFDAIADNYNLIWDTPNGVSPWLLDAEIIEKMKNAGFTLIFKDTTNDRYGQIKGNCDADLVLQAARDVFEKEYGNAIIVSSDGDFSGLVRFLQEKGKMGVVLSPSNRCSIFLLRTGAPLTYLDQVKEKIMLSNVN